jgi:transcription antitermination factor NusG
MSTLHIFRPRASISVIRRLVAGQAARAKIEVPAIDDRFPGYVLIALPDEARHLVDELPQLEPIGGASHAEAARIAATRVLPLPAWAIVGRSVRIAAGPFDGMEGELVEIDVERRNAKVAVALFGRSTPVEMAIADLRG